MTGMHAHSAPQEFSSASAAVNHERPPLSAEDADRSCRWPVLFLLTSSVKWLVLGIVLQLICSIKLHAAGFLADASWLTYGRLYPAGLNALTYGFASQAALGSALWLMARLGRAPLQWPLGVWIGQVFWNVGVLVGVLGILAGDSTGYEWLEMPGYASPLLFIGYTAIAISALLTLHARRQPTLYVSQWYLVAALFWFPWIYSTAQLLLVFFPVRGVLQAVVGGWFARNFFNLWLASAGLAIVFYFIPKLSGRPLYSRYLAAFGFWTLALFGSWGGVSQGAPVPSWIASVSFVSDVLMLVPILAVGWNLHCTLRGRYAQLKSDALLRFVVFSITAYLLAGLLQGTGLLPAIIEGFIRLAPLAAEMVIPNGSLPTLADVATFTFYSTGLHQLFIHGFVGMAVAGAIYYIVPRLTDCEWPSPGLIQFHFWTAGLGIVLSAGSLIGGGLLQGLALDNPTVDVRAIVRLSLPFLGTATVGALLILAGNVALLTNLSQVFVRCYLRCCPFKCEPEVSTGLASGAKI